ncbi:transketolase family protein [Candidatus Magnetaquicoccus inordinatus]|uniref:transketolase family protein n=1 Tax=Candidatus Magnetaquicoccus inordinatus TaxID=2496818 RepID=UPI00102AA069|nr:transketolase C-terminal domain-containing protein [Candidatus Magnetaquicoccus inordinatus]
MRRVCLDRVHQLARQQRQIIFIGSDLGSGTLEAMRKELPEQFFMEGIAEQNLLGVAAGMAMEGYIPYVNTIATFLTRRCLEQIVVDLCLPNLPVRLLANGGGLVYAPLGPTHTTQEDIALLRTLPNMAIVAPADAPEMSRLMEQSVGWPGPLYIRFAKGGDPLVSRPEDGFTIGRAICLRAGSDVVIISYGVMVKRALQTAELLAAEGISCAVYNCHTIKPLDSALLSVMAGVRLVVCAEEHSLIGGLGSALLELQNEAEMLKPTLRFALPDQFSHRYGSQDQQLAGVGLEPPAMAARIRQRLTSLM